ncbi:MAG: hypothetical protein AAFX86_13810, partial [Pseudomonadota bacterium]
MSVPVTGSCAGIGNDVFESRINARSIVAGLPLYSTATTTRPLDLDSESEITYHAKLRIARDRSGQSARRILVQSEDKSICGWASRDFVLTRDDDPKLVSDFPDAAAQAELTNADGEKIPNRLEAK